MNAKTKVEAPTVADAPRAVPFNPDARAYEAFIFGADTRCIGGTKLLDPIAATSLQEALAETTERWVWDRGQRLGVREIGAGNDLLHVYAVRKKSAPRYEYRGHRQYREHERWLEHICTIDLNVLAGSPRGLVGCEIHLHQRRQAQRPEGARLSTTGDER